MRGRAAVFLAGLGLWASTAAAQPLLEFQRFEATVTNTVVTDYNYRGVSLSARGPAARSEIELAWAWFFAGAGVSTVRLPTSPFAELQVNGGLRWIFGDHKLDLGAIRYIYPREHLGGVPTDTDYWEAYALGKYQLTERLALNGELAYAPDLSRTGAWSRYAAIAATVDLFTLHGQAGVEVALTGGIGRYWFGPVLPDLGGFRLPAYTYWHAGVIFHYGDVTFDVTYHQTNLSREDCFVFTGDPRAVTGGIVNELTNPEGLRSNWCSAAFIGRVSVDLHLIRR